MFQKNYSLQQLTTFGTEAYASYFIELQSEKEIQKAVKNRDTSLSVFVMGGGSNILFTEDYNGYIFKNSIQGIEIIEENETTAYVCSGGGVVWDNLVAYCVEHQLGGIENLSLIPGSVGASPIQNIGAYGVEVKDVFHSLTAVSMNTGEVHTFSVEECQFGYRDSIFKRELKGKYCVSNVTFKLTKASSHKLSLNYGAINDTLSKEGVFSPTIKDVRKAVCSIRSSKLPDPTVLGNAGSFFKNPELPIEVFKKLEINFPDIPRYIISDTVIKVPAGWLIEQCGWKGKRLGNIGVYEKQALVIVNYGEKDGELIKKLSYDIQQSVKEKFGVNIQAEVNIL